MMGLGGMNPKQMEKMMKQLGMNTETLDAEEVIIKCRDKTLVISNPSVQAIEMQGQKTFQVSGEAVEQSDEPEFSEEDVAMIVEQTGCSEEEAKTALEETGDIAEAILSLQK